MLAAWKLVSAPKQEALFRLFFETYGLALQNRRKFKTFLEGVIESWLDYLGEAAMKNGYSRAEARALATVMIGGFRGFLLDLITTGDRKRINRAVALWIDALDGIPEPREVPKGSA